MTMTRGDTHRATKVNMPSSLTTRQKVVHFNNAVSGTLSRQRESVCASHGLQNDPGENNCFLNSAVQIFWHLDVFRRNFRRLQEHVCLGNACIFCGIKMLFRQFQESVGTACTPDLLRRALASAFEDQQRFQLGCMDDAAECFENILLRIHYHVQGTSEVANCTDSSCIPHRKFSMNVTETFSCNECNHMSDPLVFSQMVHYVPVNALSEKTTHMKQRGVKALTGLFGKLIRQANESDNQRTCRNCGSKNAVLRRTLTNNPDIVTIGLVWESEKPKIQTISDVLHAIDTNICLCHLYRSVSDTEWASSAVHHLVGMICFYGRHYSAFFYHSRYQIWLYFDDATVKEIGPDWTHVVAKCLKGHIQPLLLFYSNPDSTIIEDPQSTLPSKTVDVSPYINHMKIMENVRNTLKQKNSRPEKNTTASTQIKTSLSDHSYLGNSISNPAVKPLPPPRTVSRPSHPPLPTKTGDLLTSWRNTAADSLLVPQAGGITETTPNTTLQPSRKSEHAPYFSPFQNYSSTQKSPEIRRGGTAASLTQTPFFPEPAVENETLPAHPRLSPRSSFTSGSIASIESFDSLDQFRDYSAYPYPFSCRDRTDSSGKDDTDSGCPSSDVSATSSVEIPVKRDALKSPPMLMSRTYYIQMVLRADDLIASASLKEDKADLCGAIKLFEQAGDLLHSCVDPLKSCVALSQAVTVKQADCRKRLLVLREKITSHGLSFTRLNQPVSSHSSSAEEGSQTVNSVTTLPRQVPHKPHINNPSVYRTVKSDPCGSSAEDTDSMKKMHKTRGKIVAQALGTRQMNQSMPDLSQADASHDYVEARGQQGNLCPGGGNLSTFQVSASDKDANHRAATRDVLLTELTERLQRKYRSKNHESTADYDNYGDLPPPPPEMLLPSASPSPEPSPLSPPKRAPAARRCLCCLCGRKIVHVPSQYCIDCNSYISQFNER